MTRRQLQVQPRSTGRIVGTTLAVGVLGFASSLLVTGCGSGEKAAAVKSAATALGSTAAHVGTTTAPATTTGPAFAVTVTVVETVPGEPVTVTTPPVVVTVTGPSETVTATAPAETVTATAPTQTATVVETTTVSNPAAAAAAGAAVASSQGAEADEGLTSDDWGWIAFGILLVLVVAGGVVWFVRRSRRNPRAAGEP
jgi:hypothetical protein